MGEHESRKSGQPYRHRARVKSHLPESRCDDQTAELLGIGYDPAGQYGPAWVLDFAAGEQNTIGVGYLPSAAATTPG